MPKINRKSDGLRRPATLAAFAVGLALLASCNIRQPSDPPIQYCPPAESPTPPPSGFSYPGLNSISMPSATEGWAVGTSADMPIVHYHNGIWTPLVGSGVVSPESSVHMISTTDGLAGGWGGVIARYHNGCWTLDRFVPLTFDIPFPRVTDVFALSPQEAWALDDGGILHYTNGKWPQLPADEHEYISNWAKGKQLTSIWMVSTNDGWAVGERGIIVHYYAGKWAGVASPTDAYLNAVQMVSSNEGWAVGSAILHYKDGTWKVQADFRTNFPGGVNLKAVSMSSTTEGWAVGVEPIDDNKGLHGRTVAFHYKDGKWTKVVVDVSGELNGVQMLSADEGWAVGDAEVYPNSGIILHYQNGTWSQYK